MNIICYDGFDWDAGNWPKCGKHGVSKEEIESLFSYGECFQLPDSAHSTSEVRHKTVGRTVTGRHILVAYTLRNLKEGTCIRPISTRYMHQKEIDYYEKVKKTLTNTNQ